MARVKDDYRSLSSVIKAGIFNVGELFFANMSERAGKMMQEDMEALGAVGLKDMDKAQSATVQIAKALADAGEIIIASGGEEDELVF